MPTIKSLRGVNNAAELADVIAIALGKYGRDVDDHLLPVLDFFEGELRLIENALRAYAEAEARAKSKP